ncbi:MAG: LysE family translocator [Pseudomonadota bacterium]
MPGTELLIAFFVAGLVFAVMPGPGVIYTIARTLSGGKGVGLQAVLGLHIGGYAHVFAAALGLTILFEAVPVLYTALKLAGAGYLVYLGLRILVARPLHETNPVMPKPKAQAFWQSVLVEVLNPKTALFFLAFLPQFTDPAAALPIWVQFLVLGTVVNILFSTSDVVYVFLADKMVRLFQRPNRVSRWMQRIGGGLLVGLGVNLAVSRS